MNHGWAKRFRINHLDYIMAYSQASERSYQAGCFALLMIINLLILLNQHITCTINHHALTCKVKSRANKPL